MVIRQQALSNVTTDSVRSISLSLELENSLETTVHLITRVLIRYYSLGNTFRFPAFFPSISWIVSKSRSAHSRKIRKKRVARRRVVAYIVAKSFVLSGIFRFRNEANFTKEIIKLHWSRAHLVSSKLKKLEIWSCLSTSLLWHSDF